LSSCPNLKKLTLTNNPIDRAPKYRLIVAALIPQLTILDNLPVDQNAKKKISNGMILEAASAMQLEQEEMDDERRMEMAILGDEFNMAMGYDHRIGGESYPIQPTRNSEIFPDTGSDLTHGSAVVLAGNNPLLLR
jgi:Leucine-rich repeat (LRR) protein